MKRHGTNKSMTSYFETFTAAYDNFLFTKGCKSALSPAIRSEARPPGCRRCTWWKRWSPWKCPLFFSESSKAHHPDDMYQCVAHTHIYEPTFSPLHHVNKSTDETAIQPGMHKYRGIALNVSYDSNWHPPRIRSQRFFALYTIEWGVWRQGHFGCATTYVPWQSSWK